MKLPPLPSKPRPLHLSAIFLVVTLSVVAQTDKPAGIKTTTRPPVNLFLHLDKSIYQPQESIWFTGYVLNRDANVMKEQNTLYVALIEPVSKSVVSKQRFLIRNGVGKGSLTLPDSISSGDYWFLGYTNSLLETGDDPIFRQLISVRTGIPSPFRISSTIIASENDSLWMKCRITTADNSPAVGGKFRYTLFDSISAIATGQKIIDPDGRISVNIGPKQDAGKYRELSVTISRGSFTKNIFFPLNMHESAGSEASIARHDPRPAVDVRMVLDSASYHQRSKVTLRIHIQGQDGQPLPGIFSLSVAASKRSPPGRIRSINSYDQFPVSDPAAVRQLKNLAGAMPDYGYVLEDNARVSRPVRMALLGSSFASFRTDPQGGFALPYSASVTAQGELNYVSVADRSPEHYKIMLYSRADTFDKQLAAIHYPLTTLNYGMTADQEDLFHLASVTTLASATVKARINELDYAKGVYNSTHCDQDYVCTHQHGALETPDILNCPYMSANGACNLVKPKEGARYTLVPKDVQYEHQHGALLVIYHCATPSVPAFIKALDPILRSNPFPLTDAGEKDTRPPGFQSTIYWNHALSTNAAGDLILSFYTNDLAGNFTCCLQGVSSAGVISGIATYSTIGDH